MNAYLVETATLLCALRFASQACFVSGRPRIRVARAYAEKRGDMAEWLASERQ